MAWNKCVARRDRYLFICKAGHMHSNSLLSAMSTIYTLIQIIFWHLAQKTGCLFYVIFSGGWAWGSHLPYPVPVFVPLYSDSLMKDICCAMPVIYTLINALENIFWCSKLFVSSSHLCFGVTLYKWCGQNEYQTFQGQVLH